MDIQKIQSYLAEHELDGWLLADFHGRNTIAVDMLSLPSMLTRRFFYFIPVHGEPAALVHNIEKTKFGHLEGAQTSFSSYKMLEEELKKTLAGVRKIAMEYSPCGRLPYIGLVDAGTLELVRSFGVEVVSSADLVANFQARLTVEQIAGHRIAARNLIEIKNKAFTYVHQALETDRKVSEYEVVQFMLSQFEQYDMETTDAPICAVGAKAGDPHYEPTKENCQVVERNQVLLLDLWAKLKTEKAVYADITWVAFTGTKADIPDNYNFLFNIVAQARDKAVAFIRENIERRPVFGYEVDDICRGVVKASGYGNNFFHRTGHSIYTSVHGPGPNIDNLETEDRRRLQQGHLFSIEPGVYFPDCGFRTEIDVLIGHQGAEVTTQPLQTAIMALF